MRKSPAAPLSILLLFAIGCNALPIVAAATPTAVPSATATFTPSLIPSPTSSPAPTETPLPTATSTPTFTPTPAQPTVTATQNAFCRWGPDTAYRSIGVDYLEAGESAVAEGRDYDATWFWVRLEGLTYHCWVSAAVVTVNFEPKSLPYVPVNVPTNNKVPSPKGVSAVRSGNQVIISWSAAPSAPELEYLIEATLCFNGYQDDVAYSTTSTSMTLPDDQNCPQKSYGRLYVVNKLGYSQPVSIPWP